MDTQRKCQNCQKDIASDAPMGLCPECLLKAGLPTGTETLGGSDSHRGFTPPPVQEIAKLFPQLEVLELIGHGGMGAVYKARQKELDRIVALKILPPDIGRDPAFAERFAREAKALARLNHPGIVTIYDFGRANGLYFFLMEFVDGVNLSQLLAGGRVSPREALAIVPQICDALQYAHDQGIVHRDIKPENILLDRRGRVKVADFGLAKLVTEANEPAQGVQFAGGSIALTESGKIMGTPQYMSPEQKQNPAEVDHRADIYALGVVFYQMLTGELPGRNFEPPSKKVQVDVRLDEVVLRAMEKNPDLRYQQASVLKTQVETIASAAPRQQNVAGPAVNPAEASSIWQQLKTRLWPPVVVRVNGHRAINWPAVMLGVGKMVFVGVLFGAVLGFGLSFQFGPEIGILTGLGYFGFVFFVGGAKAVFRILRGFSKPIGELPEFGHAAPAGFAEPASHPGLSGWLIGAFLGSILLVLALTAGAMLLVHYWSANRDNQPVSLIQPEDPKPARVRELSTPPFVAELPSGGRVELLAIRLHPSTNSPWWRLDGTPAVDYDPSIDIEGKERLASGVVALARIQWPTNKYVWPCPAGMKNLPGVDLGTGYWFATLNGRRMVEDFGVLPFEQALTSRDDTTLSLKVAAAEWRTVKVQEPGVFGRISSMGGRWGFSENATGNLEVTISKVTENPGMEYRLIAFDVDGTQYCPSSIARTRTGTDPSCKLVASFEPVTGSGVHFSLPLKRVKKVCWEARPYELISFRNVSLKPGFHTKVEVLDFGQDSATVSGQNGVIPSTLH